MSRAQLTSTVEQNTGGAAAPYVAGKNGIINGGMDIWQRGTSGFTTNNIYTADRWYSQYSGSTTFSQDSSIVPTGLLYSLKATIGGSAANVAFYQAIETLNAIRYAGQTVTLSAWIARSDAGQAYINLGYSTSTDTAVTGSWTQITSIASSNVFSTTSSMVRYILSFVVPSTAKSLLITIGNATTSVAASGTFNFTGVQLEAGSVATPFSRAGGTLQGELSLCQRYYERVTSEQLYGVFGMGKAYDTGTLQIVVPFKVTKRTAPSALDTSAMSSFQYETGGTAGNTPTSLTLGALNSSNVATLYVAKTSSFTTGSLYYLMGNNNASAYVGWSSEL